MHVKLPVGLALISAAAVIAQEPARLPATQPLTIEGDLSAQMVAGIDRFLMRAIDSSVDAREKFWQRDYSSRDAYESSVQANRERFRRYIGAVDEPVQTPVMQFIGGPDASGALAETERYSIFAVRWPALDGVFGEGLLLQPKADTLGAVIALPDADQTPEMLAGLAPGIEPESQFARRLAEAGFLVIVPMLVDRRDTWSGNPEIKRFTNQPHREWIWRQAFEMGRHMIGYEVQKVLAAVNWLDSRRRQARPDSRNQKIGLAGYGEGGLIAFYAAALDLRIDTTLVSGYFAARERVWEEPIYRDVWGLLLEFGDAEIASLIAPRGLIVEFSEAPRVEGPPQPREGRAGVAAPGKIVTPEFHLVELEVERANALLRPLTKTNFIVFKFRNEGQPVGPGSERALVSLLNQLGVPDKRLGPALQPAAQARRSIDADDRQKRQFTELVNYTQRLLNVCERTRDTFFWKQTKASSAEEWQVSTRAFKTNMWEELIGRFPAPSVPANARSRKTHEKEKWIGYDVMLDVWPDVFAWGVLLVPRDLKPGERRPVVVCQHGLEGLPIDTIVDDPKARGFAAYKAFAARLAERGFIVFAPHNPYRGQYAFRVLQRKAHPLKKSLFAVILGQHERLLDWLSALPFVDPARIGFYGLSYGGKTAMRVPSLLDRYCLSICSADYNEWAKKCATIESAYSYLYTVELDMYEFNLGHTFNYAEMAGLIAPRPFMVERGHDDGVAPDEWVAYEYAKVRRLYAKLGLPERTEIEFFNGPHTINGVRTFQFLHQHLQWPAPK
jgi:dienelactone hydrolase